jgi:hypothetical protein
MKPLHSITVTSRPTAVVKPQPAPADGQQFAAAKIRHRFRAEFTAGPFTGQAVEGFLSWDEAVGALVRSVAKSLPTADAVFDFVASVLDDTRFRCGNESMGRAVRFAARDKMRRNPGSTLTFIDPQNPPKPAVSEPAAVKGGVA